MKVSHWFVSRKNLMQTRFAHRYCLIRTAPIENPLAQENNSALRPDRHGFFAGKQHEVNWNPPSGRFQLTTPPGGKPPCGTGGGGGCLFLIATSMAGRWPIFRTPYSFPSKEKKGVA